MGITEGQDALALLSSLGAGGQTAPGSGSPYPPRDTAKMLRPIGFRESFPRWHGSTALYPVSGRLMHTLVPMYAGEQTDGVIFYAGNTSAVNQNHSFATLYELMGDGSLVRRAVSNDIPTTAWNGPRTYLWTTPFDVTDNAFFYFGLCKVGTGTGATDQGSVVCSNSVPTGVGSGPNTFPSLAIFGSTGLTTPASAPAVETVQTFELNRTMPLYLNVI